MSPRYSFESSPNCFRLFSASQAARHSKNARSTTAFREPAAFSGKHLVIFGGGDLALDWMLDLAAKAGRVTLMHRREEFRAAPASVTKLRDLAAAGRIEYIQGVAQDLVIGGNASTGVVVKGTDGMLHTVAADHLLVFFGLHPKLETDSTIGDRP